MTQCEHELALDTTVTTITKTTNAHLVKDTQAVIPIIITCIAVFVIAVVIATFITTTVVLIRSKAKIKKELEDTKARMNTEIYEEIDCRQISATPVDTNKNIAYAEVSRQ